MEVLSLIRLALHTAYIGEYLHFRYLKNPPVPDCGKFLDLMWLEGWKIPSDLFFLGGGLTGSILWIKSSKM